jgi:hypothetical protein
MHDTPPIPARADRARHRLADAARGAAAGLAAGVVYGGATGACFGLPPGLFYIPIAWVISCPLYGLIGAALGGATGVIVGAAGLASRSPRVAALAGCALAVALGAGLTTWAWRAAGATFQPVTGRIDPAATDEDEAENQRRYRIWSDEQVAGERGGLILFVVAPATLCALMATFGATRGVTREVGRQGIRPDDGAGG